MENTAHCQICKREIKIKNGKIVRHGPGSLSGYKVCPGSNQAPREVACDAIVEVIANYQSIMQAKSDAILANIMNPPARLEIKMFTKSDIAFDKPADFDPRKKCDDKPASSYAALFHRQQSHLALEFKRAFDDKEFFEKRLTEWQTEPEVVNAL